MRIAIIGAGIVGVTSAYELAVDGHEVHVFEAGPAVAGGASFADAGLLAAGDVRPWAAPGMAQRLLGGLFQRHPPLRGNGLATLRLLPWLWRGWRASKPEIYRANRQRMVRLARFSREHLERLNDDLGLSYERSTGCLLLLRGEAELRQARAGIGMLSEWGVPFELLDGTKARALEPGLNDAAPLRAAIRLPQDGVGNCRQFAQLLKAEAIRHGAQFHFGQAVRALRPGASATVQLPTGDHLFDAVVVCAGTSSASLLAPLGLRLPLAEVLQHSLTAPLRQVENHEPLGPRSALVDEHHRVAITRLGQRVRVSGGAVLGGLGGKMAPAPLATLYKVLHDWFPGAAQLSQAQPWRGAQAVLPDGPPVLGPSGHAGIWLNVGHGSAGWALAAGSARLLADAIGGRPSASGLDGLGLDRLFPGSR